MWKVRKIFHESKKIKVENVLFSFINIALLNYYYWERELW